MGRGRGGGVECRTGSWEAGENLEWVMGENHRSGSMLEAMSQGFWCVVGNPMEGARRVRGREHGEGGVRLVGGDSMPLCGVGVANCQV